MATVNPKYWNGWNLNEVYHCYGDLPEQDGDYRVCHHCHCLFPINALGVRTRRNKITCSNKCRVAMSRDKARTKLIREMLRDGMARLQRTLG